MKNIQKIILFIIFIGCLTNLKAQNNWSIGVGGIASERLLARFAGTNIKNIGPFSVNYHHEMEERFKIGASLVYSQARYTDNTTNNIAVMAHAHYTYLDNTSFQLYSGISYGIQNSFDRDCQHSKSVMHLTLIGARVGRDLAFFGELGYGIKSIVHVGITQEF
jgi:hypothetical protein